MFFSKLASTLPRPSLSTPAGDAAGARRRTTTCSCRLEELLNLAIGHDTETLWGLGVGHAILLTCQLERSMTSRAHRCAPRHILLWITKSIVNPGVGKVGG